MITNNIYIGSPPPFLDQRTATPMPPVQRHLVTFHNGYPFSLAADRLGRQAKGTGWFASVTLIHPGADHPALQTFTREHSEFVRNNPRGYGYWRWKPLLLQAMLAALPDGAHLYYMDAGCELSRLGADRFAVLDNELAVRGILCFEIDFQELGWCKREAAEAILGDGNDALMSSRQIQATWFGLCNTAPVRAMVDEWAGWATQGDLITDAHAPARQHPKFREHRHDQALLSLVLKKNGVKPMPQEDRFERGLYVRDSWVLLAPVHGLRSRKKRSRIDGIITRSSKNGCLGNLRTPSMLFRGRLIFYRWQVQAIDAINRIRSRLRTAFH